MRSPELSKRRTRIRPAPVSAMKMSSPLGAVMVCKRRSGGEKQKIGICTSLGVHRLGLPHLSRVEEAWAYAGHVSDGEALRHSRKDPGRPRDQRWSVLCRGRVERAGQVSGSDQAADARCILQIAPECFCACSGGPASDLQPSTLENTSEIYVSSFGGKVAQPRLLQCISELS